MNVLGGFGGHIEHDPHILSTLSAVQILITYDRLDAIQVDKVVDCKSEMAMVTVRSVDQEFIDLILRPILFLHFKTLN